MFSSPQTLMVQGTTSDAGKSILVTAICRIIARHGMSVAPFKPQNMALNSAVTVEGGEIGRAQAVQAEACFLAPSVLMNPVLLKPNSDTGSQVIVNGKAIGNMSATQYHAYKPELLQTVLAAHASLAKTVSVVIVEGAGSPAEINLREHDIANMGFAEALDCPVIIVADIDRGGVFAHLYGTYALLSESEQKRVKGFVINRFRGDPALLDSGLRWLKEKTSVPVLAVIPYIHNLHIEAEDSISQNQLEQNADQTNSTMKVVVPMYPRASNHTDFDVLRMHPQIDCEFIKDSSKFSGADLIILPGSKSVRGDLQWLKDSGWDAIIHRHLRFGGKVLGICGGFQMLGETISDPQAIESAAGCSDGLGLLAMQTTLNDNKILRNISGVCLETQAIIKGYEIHAGLSEGSDLARPLFSVRASDSEDATWLDGAKNADDSVRGSYIHGLFDQPDMLQSLLKWAGLEGGEAFDYPAHREQQIERLADEVEAVMPINMLNELLDIQQSSV